MCLFKVELKIKNLKLNHSAITENIKRFTKMYYVVLNYDKMNFNGEYQSPWWSYDNSRLYHWQKKWYWFNFIWWNIFSKLKNAHIKFTEYAGGDKFINVPISLHVRSHASHEKECQIIICEYMSTQISRNYR